MNWIVLVAISVIASASEIFIDNYISDYYFKGRGAVSQKFFFAISQIVIALVLGTIIYFISGIDFANTPVTVFILLIGAGFCSTVGSIFYYKALELDDSTNLGIFIQLAPILYLIFGWFLLGQTFNPMQLLAFVVILSAPLLIILTTRKKSRKIRIRAALYAFLYILIATLANIVFVRQDADATNLGFLTELTFLYLGKGLGNLTIMGFSPKLRRRFHQVVKSSHKKVYRPLFATLMASVIYNLTYNLALIIAPSVAIASAASDSSTPIAIFFMGIVLSLIWPKFGREKVDRRTTTVHFIATILVVIGIILIQNFS